MAGTPEQITNVAGWSTDRSSQPDAGITWYFLILEKYDGSFTVLSPVPTEPAGTGDEVTEAELQAHIDDVTRRATHHRIALVAGGGDADSGGLTTDGDRDTFLDLASGAGAIEKRYADESTITDAIIDIVVDAGSTLRVHAITSSGLTSGTAVTPIVRTGGVTVTLAGVSRGFELSKVGAGTDRISEIVAYEATAQLLDDIADTATLALSTAIQEGLDRQSADLAIQARLAALESRPNSDVATGLTLIARLERVDDITPTYKSVPVLWPDFSLFDDDDIILVRGDDSTITGAATPVADTLLKAFAFKQVMPNPDLMYSQNNRNHLFIEVIVGAPHGSSTYRMALSQGLDLRFKAASINNSVLANIGTYSFYRLSVQPLTEAYEQLDLARFFAITGYAYATQNNSFTSLIFSPALFANLSTAVTMMRLDAAVTDSFDFGANAALTNRSITYDVVINCLRPGLLRIFIDFSIAPAQELNNLTYGFALIKLETDNTLATVEAQASRVVRGNVLGMHVLSLQVAPGERFAFAFGQLTGVLTTWDSINVAAGIESVKAALQPAAASGSATGCSNQPGAVGPGL